MEVITKRLAVLLVVVLLLCGHQQAAAMSKFCRCYRQCYADCRKSSGTYPCNFGCIQDCINAQLPPARPASAADCNRACLIPICGVDDPDTATAALGGADDACVDECTKSIGVGQLLS
ncbi:hypothetical protein U9M48_025903 [Paspalum notatum var. saurae]|uniref:Acidic protein n=1 Tax=Paspalum notatum var. saurae TaxID=547442 RepID=A0AAQ3TTI9_PASNO